MPNTKIAQKEPVVRFDRMRAAQNLDPFNTNINGRREAPYVLVRIRDAGHRSVKVVNDREHTLYKVPVEPNNFA